MKKDVGCLEWSELTLHQITILENESGVNSYGKFRWSAYATWRRSGLDGCYFPILEFKGLIIRRKSVTFVWIT